MHIQQQILMISEQVQEWLKKSF